MTVLDEPIEQGLGKDWLKKRGISPDRPGWR
jgi:hypothetical protein